MTVTLDEFSAGMRKLAASVTIITTAHKGERYGLTASAVTSLSAEPPSLLACVHKEANACDPIGLARTFCVNILSRDQRELSNTFAMEPHDHRFDHGHWDMTPLGLPRLKGAAASFECDVMDILPGFSHNVFVGLIRAVHIGEGQALLYADGEYGHFNLPQL